MPSNVTFDDDVITTDDIVNALDKPMVEEDIPDTEVSSFRCIFVTTSNFGLGLAVLKLSRHFSLIKGPSHFLCNNARFP